MTLSRIGIQQRENGLVVAKTAHGKAMRPRDGLHATVVVSAHDAKLAAALTGALENALRTTADSLSAPTFAIVRLRTLRRLEALGPSALASAIAVVKVTERNARRLPKLVDTLRKANALGVQLVWDGETPSRILVEQHVFRVLETARAIPNQMPVVVAPTDVPTFTLRTMVAGRPRKDVPPA